MKNVILLLFIIFVMAGCFSKEKENVALSAKADGVSIESNDNNLKRAVSPTTIAPRFYSNITSSPAYANFSSFAANLNTTYTFVIPGLVNTNVAGTNCGTMVPQGVCFAGDYVLITAYDSNNTANSVVYVMSTVNNQNRYYLTTIVLNSKSHVGGIAYDGTNVWVCDGGSVGGIKYSTIQSIVASGAAYSVQSYFKKLAVNTTASYAAYYDSKLWVGDFNQTAEGTLYGYSISNKDTTSPTLTAKNRMTTPDRTQGVSIRDGAMILSRSYSRDIGSASYISELRVYKPDWANPTSTGFIYKNNAVKTMTMPPMAEGVIMGSTYTYVLFESVATVYSMGTIKCKYPVDRICGFPTANLIN